MVRVSTSRLRFMDVNQGNDTALMQAVTRTLGNCIM